MQKLAFPENKTRHASYLIPASCTPMLKPCGPWLPCTLSSACPFRAWHHQTSRSRHSRLSPLHGCMACPTHDGSRDRACCVEARPGGAPVACCTQAWTMDSGSSRLPPTFANFAGRPRSIRGHSDTYTVRRTRSRASTTKSSAHGQSRPCSLPRPQTLRDGHFDA